MALESEGLPDLPESSHRVVSTRRVYILGGGGGRAGYSSVDPCDTASGGDELDERHEGQPYRRWEVHGVQCLSRWCVGACWSNDIGREGD